jgi:DeoD family purine-nucleoside phosphorylase
MPQIHLRAEVGDYAPTILLPGDPNRATRIAEKFDGGLEAARLVNSHRGLLGYTGTYKGTPISVQTSGMGAPTMAIVVEELLRLGAKRMIRVGTAGGFGRGVRTGDMVVATSAAPADGATRVYTHGEPYAPSADYRIVKALVESCHRHHLKAHVGQVVTVDVFYNPDPDYATRWRNRGVLAVEMESSVFFYLAARAHAAGADVAAGTILTVSDVLSEEESSEDTYVGLDQLDKQIDPEIEVALDAAFHVASAG